MVDRKLFRPAIIGRLTNCYLVVDQIQPVAITVSPAGEIIDVASWNHLPPPTVGDTWPRRRLNLIDSVWWLTDLDGATSVALATDSDGQISPIFDQLPRDVQERATSRKYLNELVSKASSTVDNATWHYRTLRSQWYKVSCEVMLATSSASQNWNLGAGSIVDHEVVGASTLVSVRRANLRPLVFSSPYDLYAFSPESDNYSPLAIRKVSDIDITEHCWRRATPDAPFRDATDYFLNYSLHECAEAHRIGARNISSGIRDIDSHPVIETTFELADIPGVQFRRTDTLFNELGNKTGGLRGRLVFIAEDLANAHESLGAIQGPVFDF
jgi:hypothetical protein